VGRGWETGARTRAKCVCDDEENKGCLKLLIELSEGEKHIVGEAAVGVAQCRVAHLGCARVARGDARGGDGEARREGRAERADARRLEAHGASRRSSRPHLQAAHHVVEACRSSSSTRPQAAVQRHEHRLSTPGRVQRPAGGAYAAHAHQGRQSILVSSHHARHCRATAACSAQCRRWSWS
jgi:hypothetical protein